MAANGKLPCGYGDMEESRKPHVQYRLLISTITIEGESSNPRWSLPGKVKYKLRRRLDKQIQN